MSDDELALRNWYRGQASLHANFDCWPMAYTLLFQMQQTLQQQDSSIPIRW